MTLNRHITVHFREARLFSLVQKFFMFLVLKFDFECFFLRIQEKLLSAQGQQGWNQLYDLLQSELQLRPSDAHVNRRLVQLYSLDRRPEEAAEHCVAVESTGVLRHSLDWYTTVVHMLQVGEVTFCSGNSELS